MSENSRAVRLLGAMTNSWLGRYSQTFSFWGLVVGTLFFSASLTPSLLPRPHFVQGVLAGFAAAVGYGVGVSFIALWQYLELPRASGRLDRYSRYASVVVAALIAVGFLWRNSVWQNSIRELMGMEPVATTHPMRVGFIAVLMAVALVASARGLRYCWQVIHRRVSRFVPRRVSYVLSTILVFILVILVANHIIARQALNLADAVFREIDERSDHEIPQPTEPNASGSEASLIAWDSIGLQGKNFVVHGPTEQEISDFLGRQAQAPLRVYVGVRSRESMQERAQLALEELKRVGGFERSVLVVTTPTGTGWLDPGAVDTIEYLHGGDTAIVSMQYSYLPSWITILVDPERSRHSAQYLFKEIYNYWTRLPHDHRPKLYLHGLSLGSLGSESSTDMFTIFADPFQGALWSGPPFPSTDWNELTRARNPGSPMWLPTFRDGSLVRFTGRESCLQDQGDRWGPMRIVYVQHASDPMVFFSGSLLFRRPEWLQGQRGPDVSPYLNWCPIVTFLQVGFDLPMATSVPTGYGHNYAPSTYLDAWIAVTNPPNWTTDDTRRLKALLAQQAGSNSPFAAPRPREGSGSP